jgi:hypothetical protein
MYPRQEMQGWLPRDFEVARDAPRCRQPWPPSILRIITKGRERERKRGEKKRSIFYRELELYIVDVTIHHN